MKLLTIIFVLVFSLSVFSQTTETAPAKPKTNLETFQEKYGSVLIKGYSIIGKMSGRGGIVTVQALTLNNPAIKTTVRGLIVEVDTSERYSTSARSFVEYDEIDSLIKGIAYISKIDKSATAFNSFEAKYKTKDDFSVTVFNDSQDKLSAVIAVGAYSRKSVFVELADVATLVTHLQNGKAALDTVK